MSLSLLWTISMAAAVLYSCYAGTLSALTQGLTQGVTAAVDFCLGTGAMMLFWCGLFSVMEQAGLTRSLARALRPILRPLFPRAAQRPGVCASLCANVSANLLGLGNAATPMGIRAARGIAALPGTGKELATLVVLNTASIQLLPTTVVSIRSAMGSAAPLDILPCVLLSSVLSVGAGLTAVRLLYRL